MAKAMSPSSPPDAPPANSTMAALGRRDFVVKAWTLIRPYWVSEERWRARGLLALVVALELGQVGLTVLYAEWNQQFFNALQDSDQATFLALLWKFGLIAGAFIVAAGYSLFFTQMLQIRWRRWLTARLCDDWLAHRAYYLLQLERPDVENPEQRIQDDVDRVVGLTLSLSIGLLNALVTLFSFLTMLWALSGALSIPLGERTINIPGYMVWVALLYAGAGTLVTHLIGRRLVPINFDLQKYNAGFRYGMIRIRDNAESVALYRGEKDENRRLRDAFANIWTVWRQQMFTQKYLTFFTAGYSQLAGIFPLLVASPRYFAGEIPLGVLTQTAVAFGQVQSSLSWFIGAYASLAEWTASTGRLIGFAAALKQMQATADSALRVVPGPEPSLRLAGVDIRLPNGQPLLDDVALVIGAGDRLLVTGASGSGKSTLFRALAGIWPYGQGMISVPQDARVLFLPQKPYLSIAPLADVLCYPDEAGVHGEDELRRALIDARLPQLTLRLAETSNWSMRLSVGEQQRIGFARALLYRPDWLFLDEATSALDPDTEQVLYRLLVERLPGCSIISIAHRPDVARWHTRQIEIVPAARRVHEREVGTAAAGGPAST